MFSYHTYGLRIDSGFELPELPELREVRDVSEHREHRELRENADRTGEPDVLIRQKSLHPGPLESLTDSWAIGVVSADEWYLASDEVGTFRLREGRSCIVDAGTDVEGSVLRQFLLGPVFAALLHQRGTLTLHGSCVSGDQGAVAFLGAAGTGKSTIAAACVGDGWTLLADDVTPIRGSSRPAVPPGPPVCKLTSETADALDAPFERLPRPALPKDYYRTERGGPPSAGRLRRLYVLEEGDSPRVRDHTTRDGLLDILAHSYAGPLVGPTETDAEHFRRVERLANAVAVKRLATGGTRADLPEVVDAVRRDLANGT